MNVLKKQFSKVLEKEVRFEIKEAKNLAIPFCKEPSNPIVIFQCGKTERLVEPIPDRALRSRDVIYNYEGLINPGFENRISIQIRDNGIVIGTCKISIQKLYRGVRDSRWYKLKPEGQGEILIQMVAINFGKIEKPPLTLQSLPVPINNSSYIQTRSSKTLSKPVAENQQILKQYKKQQIKRILPHIAAGHFGIVYKGYVRDRKELVAIKDIKVTDYTLFEEWKREVEFMSQHSNKFVVQVHGFCCSSKILTIVMEYMEKGSLFDILHGDGRKEICLNGFDRLRMARQVSMGVTFLHANKILHRDIKSLNILVSRDGICKLADFGSARLVTNTDVSEYFTADVGTPLWMAPEVRNGDTYNLPADLFSLGIVLYEIFENCLPNYNQKERAIEINDIQFPSACLVIPLLNLDPSLRPTAESTARKLDFLLRFYMEKLGDTTIDKESIMTSPVGTLSRETQILNSILIEGFEVIMNLVDDDTEDSELDYDDQFEDIDIEERDCEGTLNRKKARSFSAARTKSYVAQTSQKLEKRSSSKSSPRVAAPPLLRSISQNNGPKLKHSLVHQQQPLTPKSVDNGNLVSPQSKSLKSSHEDIGRVSYSSSGKENFIISPSKSDQPSCGRMLYSFVPENPGELSVLVDEQVEVLGVNGEWAECRTADNRFGWVPLNYVHILF